MAFGKLSNKFNSFFSMEEELPEDLDSPLPPVQEQSAPPPAPTFRGNKVVDMKQAPAGEHTAKIVVYEPRSYADAKEIGGHLLNNKAVVVNFAHLESQDAMRVVDFLTGTVFAVSGEIKRIGERIFLVTPANFAIDGSLTKGLGDEDWLHN